MYYIGLDLGLHLGYTIFDDTKYVYSDANTLGKKVSKESIVRLRDILESTISAYFPCIVGYEEIKQYHKSKNAARAFGMYEGILLLVCADLNIDVYGFGVAEIKKMACGKGNADKEEVLFACNSELHLYPKSYDEADSMWVAYLLKSKFVTNAQVI